jgi:hypothetical protein
VAPTADAPSDPTRLEYEALMKGIPEAQESDGDLVAQTPGVVEGAGLRRAGSLRRIVIGSRMMHALVCRFVAAVFLAAGCGDFGAESPANTEFRFETPIALDCDDMVAWSYDCAVPESGSAFPDAFPDELEAPPSPITDCEGDTRLEPGGELLGFSDLPSGVECQIEVVVETDDERCKGTAIRPNHIDTAVFRSELTCEPIDIP